MSELKAINAYQLTTNTEDSDVYIHNDEFGCGGDLVECYLKSEADKVIAELEESHKKELLIEILNITRGAISMFKTSNCCRGFDRESPLGKIANAAFKHWCYVESIQQKCINFERDEKSSRQLRIQLMDQVERSQNRILHQAMELRHQKYKRCLAMAEMCKARYDEEDAKVNGCGASWEYISKEMKYWERWQWRWESLAEKFKHNNSTAQRAKE